MRWLAAGVLVAALAAGWLIVSRGHEAPAVPRASPGASTLPASTTTGRTSATSRLRAVLSGGTSCVDVQGRTPEVTCVIDRVRVDARLVGKASLLHGYTAAAGARPAARRGLPACATGHDDERAWSRPAAPTRVVGRYRCRLEGGHAAIWWTDDHGVLAHAVAADHDLSRLFAWWRTHLVS
jgi:hypothetical protein